MTSSSFDCGKREKKRKEEKRKEEKKIEKKRKEEKRRAWAFTRNRLKAEPEVNGGGRRGG